MTYCGRDATGVESQILEFGTYSANDEQFFVRDASCSLHAILFVRSGVISRPEPVTCFDLPPE